MGVDEGSSARPEAGKGAGVVQDVHIEAILEVIVAHESENVIVNIAEEVDLQ